MKVIVSTNNYQHDGYKTTKTLKNIDWNKVDCLIFHSSIDSEVEVILDLAKVAEVVPKKIYINQLIHSLYYGIFAGMDSDIYNDATMLEDTDTLNYLVESYKNTGMTVKSPNIDVETISKFVATVSKESAETLEKLIANGFWLKTLDTAMMNVETALVRSNETNSSMVEVLNKTAEMVEELHKRNEKTSEEIEKLGKFIQETQSKGQEAGQNTAFYFTTYTVPHTVSKVLYIRVFSPCTYLVSFLMAYQHYLKMHKQKSSKVLLSAPKLKQFLKKYNDFPRLAPESVGVVGIESKGDFFVTHEPKPLVLNTFFNMKTDLFIVIDMMFGDNLIAGAKVIPLNAINAISDIKRFKLQASKCIISTTGPTQSILIPSLPRYVTATDSAKKTLYYNTCKDSTYKKLDTLIWG